jgi:hypothetical protein
MSSINSSDSSSNRQDEVVRRNREDYKQKESELVKKHQKEIRRLNETHYAEVEGLKESHTDQMQEMQQKSRENLSRRDMKYQREIENLRNLHRKQMSDLSEDAQSKVSFAEKESDNRISQAERQFTERAAELNDSHLAESQQKEKAFEENLQDLRETQKEAIESNRDKLNSKHEREMKTLVEGGSTDRAELNRAYRNYRQNAEGRLKQQELQHMRDKERASDNFLGAMKNERIAESEVAENMRQGFRDSIQDVEEKYSNQRRKDMKNAAIADEELRHGVYGRINGKVRSLENDVRDLEAKNVRDRVSRDQAKAREMKNLKDAYQANVDDYKHQKEELLVQSRESNHDDIQELQGEHSQQMQNTTRQYLGRMQMENAKNREAITSLKNDFEARQEQTSTQADHRVKNVVDSVNEDKARMTKNYQTNFDLMRQQQSDEVKNLQMDHMQNKAEALERLKEQMRQRELQHQEKLTLLKGKYEKQIAELNDRRTVEKRTSDEYIKRQADDLKRSHQMELETQQSQFRDKIAKLQEQHDVEMQTLNSRHEEQVDQLVGAMRKS